MNTQDKNYQTVLTQLHGDIAELKSSAHKLAEENLVLRAQVNIQMKIPKCFRETQLTSFFKKYFHRRWNSICF